MPISKLSIILQHFSNSLFLSSYDLINDQDISRISFELVRVYGDRILMAWEDDRGQLLREIFRLEKVCIKKERTIDFVKKEFLEYRQLHASALASNSISSRLRGLLPDSEIRSDKLAKKQRVCAEEPALAVVPEPGLMKLSVCSVSGGSNLVGTSATTSVATSSRAVPPSQLALAQQSTANHVLSLSRKPSSSVPLSFSSELKTNDLGRAGTVQLESPKKIVNSISVYSSNKFTSRKRSDREKLPGHTCFECEKYMRVLAQQGVIVDDAQMKEMLQRCSRHKFNQGPPPDTPDGFWDLTVHTPEEWKQKI